MFKNFFSWNDSEFYYDEPERELAVDTAASQVIRYPSSYTSSGMTNPPVMVERREPPVVKQVPPPVKVMTPPPVKVVVPEPRIDRNMAAPPPMVKTQLPPALEYKTMEFWVPLCCEGCPQRIEKKLRSSRVTKRGVDSVSCDLAYKKVTVRGYAMPHEVLGVLQKMFKRAMYWPSVVKPVIVQKGGPGGPVKVANVMEPVKVAHGQTPHGPRPVVV